MTSTLRRSILVALVASLALVASAVPSPAGKVSDSRAHATLRASIGGSETPRSADARIVVDQVEGEIDSAFVTLPGAAGARFAAGVREGDDLSVDAEIGGARGVVFRGEVAGVEPAYEEGHPDGVVVRAFDRLHRLTRGRKSRTFQDATDADVVRTIAKENGLVAAPAAGLVERYGAVYQHDQTDLEFLLERASRLDFAVFVDDETLVFDQQRPPAEIDLGVKRPDGDVRLRDFHPRLSSSSSVQKVTVRGWDPQKKEVVVGSARVATILLVPGGEAPGLLFGRSVEIAPEPAPSSVEEAEAMARAALTVANPLSGEAACAGDPDLYAGVTVEIAGAGARFDGKYHVTGAQHQYCPPPCDSGGYRTVLRVRRQDGALFFLPALDREVLVDFAHGDLAHPIVVGSLWNGVDKPPHR